MALDPLSNGIVPACKNIPVCSLCTLPRAITICYKLSVNRKQSNEPYVLWLKTARILYRVMWGYRQHWVRDHGGCRLLSFGITLDVLALLLPAPGLCKENPFQERASVIILQVKICWGPQDCKLIRTVTTTRSQDLLAPTPSLPLYLKNHI